MPVVIIGTTIHGLDNFMAEGWITRANGNPPMLAMGIRRARHTCAGIEEHQAFSVNIPGAALLEQTDAVGLVSGKQVDKSQVFETFTGELAGAPLIKNAAVALACRLVQTAELPSHNLYVGEIVEAWSDQAFMTGTKLDLKKMDVFLLSMPDNRYWSLGHELGKAWNADNKHLIP